MSADDRRTARQERFQLQRGADNGEDTPPPGGGGGGNRGRGPISPIGGGGKVSKEIQSQLDKNIPGTAAWLANNAGALEEFNKVKDQMNEEINSLSAEQRKIHDAAATKIQAMARARHGRLIVQEIRNQKQKEEDEKM